MNTKRKYGLSPIEWTLYHESKPGQKYDRQCPNCHKEIPKEREGFLLCAECEKALENEEIGDL